MLKQNNNLQFMLWIFEKERDITCIITSQEKG